MKAAKSGCYPESARDKLFEDLKAHIKAEGDVSFLDDDGIQHIFGKDELSELLTVARSDLLEELDTIIEEAADNFDADADAESWFDDLRDSLRTLNKLFPDDEEVNHSVQLAQRNIDVQISMLEGMYSNSWESESPSHVTGQAAVSQEGRSIFDDLVSS